MRYGTIEEHTSVKLSAWASKRLDYLARSMKCSRVAAAEAAIVHAAGLKGEQIAARREVSAGKRGGKPATVGAILEGVVDTLAKGGDVR